MPDSRPRSEETPWRRDIDAIQEEARAAFQDRNVARLREIFADDLVVHSPIHRVNDKETVLDLLERGVIGHTSSVEHVEHVRRQGDHVIVMGYDVVTNPPDETPIHRRFTNVWRAHGGGWQLAIRHATPFTPATSP
jgi:ketosteroid isomerase-like protein